MTSDSLWGCRSESGANERAEFRLHGQVRWRLRQFQGIHGQDRYSVTSKIRARRLVTS